MKKIIGQPIQTNTKLIELIKKTKINNYYIKNQADFRNRIVEDIGLNDDVLDIGKGMRNKFVNIKSKKITTVDVNDFGDYPDIIYDICSDPDQILVEKFDKIICLAVLEHVYDPFVAINNLRKMLKKNGVIYGYAPFLYHYHAPEDLSFQDFYRFSKDGLAYLFKDFRSITLYPVRGRLSSAMHILFGSFWKKTFEKYHLNPIADKFFSEKKNFYQAGGFNFKLIK